MRSHFELAALPPTLQLCLQSADRCGGLLKSHQTGLYHGRHDHAQEIGAAYAGLDVLALLQMGLLSCSDAPDRLFLATNDGIELLNTGVLRRQVGA